MPLAPLPLQSGYKKTSARWSWPRGGSFSYHESSTLCTTLWISVDLFCKSLSHVNGNGYGATNHWVVTDTEEAHHFNVSRY